MCIHIKVSFPKSINKLKLHEDIVLLKTVYSIFYISIYVIIYISILCILIELIFSYVFHVIFATVKSVHSTSKSILCELISIDNCQEFIFTKSVGENSFFFTEFISQKTRDEQSGLQRPHTVHSKIKVL